MTTDLPVPDDQWTVTERLLVTAELLALAEKVAALHGNGGPTYRDGYDAAIGAVRELIADRCDELGVKVEEL